MAETSNWAFPPRLQPQPDELRFDLEAALRSVVLVHAEIPDEAFTASILGTERIGHGTVIGADGLVLTMGYLITEAETIWLTAHDGTVVPGHALAYDQVTGFGLILPLGHLDVVPIERGSAAATTVGDSVIVIGHGGVEHALDAKVVSRREFAGYWEYLLEDALFTSPPHPQWGGAALEPILEDMKKLGRAARSPRPWLGMYTTPMQGSLVVGQLTQGGPAHKAGIRLGDVVLEVAGEPVADLADLFRRIWETGSAGAEVPLTLARGKSTSRVRVTSANRDDFLTKPRRH
jgi:S1-C subfamily serine protease